MRSRVLSVLRMRSVNRGGGAIDRPFKHFLYTHTHTHRTQSVKILCADPSTLILRPRTCVENLSVTSPWLSAISLSVV
ncbi:hypothetical protein PDJAM_G00204810 [Pangasius djambal]|uniref:Uncharacterized protein n=1 Tax=Pangasius djambal TaxID=1691987 RepID=A0ACC5Y854_9TELE|nr:hypothetical protein [Pangasius djambal]